MLLILSARTVGEDIALHYGRLPPSFLPLGNQRLFALQVELADGDPVAMTVPETFEIPEIDRAEIDRLGIRLLPQDPRLSLTGAIRDALERLTPEGPLRLLYGDTMVRMEDAPAGDLVAVQQTSANYQWAYVDDGSGDAPFTDAPPQRLDTRQVVCGYYVFADPARLARACEGTDIVGALNRYFEGRPPALAEAREWFDFGHLPLYFQSKKFIMIKRVFNRIDYEDHLLIKQSDDIAKMRAEAHWYEALPGDLQLHVPRYRGRVERDFRAGYAIEYLYAPLLSDLAAFGALPLSSWLEILAACFEFADKCQAHRPAPGAPEAAPAFAGRFFRRMMVDKTWERLGAWLGTVDLTLDDRITLDGTAFPPLREVVDRVIAKVPPTRPEDICFWHGDMFYGNMFYDFTARRIMAIDPRGQVDVGQDCLYGDRRYDLAKLAHSVIGQYDRILLGRARLHEGPDRAWRLEIAAPAHQAQVEEIFLSQVVTRYGLDRDELVALTALLFFSMLPLHRDRPDLQRQMLANALRLAGRIEGVAE